MPAFYPVTLTANSAAPSAANSAGGTIAIAGALTVSASADKQSYTRPAKGNQSLYATITTNVVSGSMAVSGASVSVKVRDPGGSITTLTATTGATGAATVFFPFKRQSAAGTYSATITATMGGMSNTATLTFVLN